MNPAAFGRIFWKEYRTQWAGWIAIALAIVLFTVALLMNPWITRDERTRAIFAITITLAALYALGSSVTLFATERENGTYDFLKALPVGSWTVFFGKAVFAIGSAAVMFAFAWLVALAASGGLPDARSHRLMWTYCGLTAVEFLAWGMLFSLLTRRTLVAASLAGTVTALFLSWLWNGDKSPVESVTGRVAIICAVTVLNLFLANRWLRERRLRSAGTAGSTTRLGEPASVSRKGQVGRLVWQDMRQSAVVTAAILIALLPLALTVWVEWLRGVRVDAEIRSNVVYPVFIILLLFGSLTPTLLGSTIFLGDQTGYHFRFLAEHGFPPRLVWLSRHIRGLAVLVLGLLLFLPPQISLIVNAQFNRTLEVRDSQLEVLGVQIGFVAVAYACGQVCSMIFRSGILSAAFGGILTALVCGWAALVSVFGMSWWWTVAPLLVTFLVVTWLHAKNWFVERKGWRDWRHPALVVAFPAVAILGAIPLARIYEFPLVDPGFDPKEVKWPVTPEEEKAHALYLRAIEEIWTANRPRGDRARREAEAKAIDLALKACRYPLPGFCPYGPAISEELHWNVEDAEIKLAELVFASGVALQAEGKLDAALDRYLAADHIALHVRQCWPFAWFALGFELRIREQLTYWAAERGQTSERVLKAALALEEQGRISTMTCDELRYWYLQTRHTLEGDPEHGLGTSYYRVSDYVAITRWLPWERVRAMRILNTLTAAQFAGCRETNAAMAAGGVAPLPTFRWYRHPTKDKVTYNTVWDLVLSRPRGYASYERYRRATQLVLAIEAWRLDHGKLPESLDRLLGKYLERLPVDPYTGQQLGYEPKGFRERVVFYIHTNEAPNVRALEPGQPFVGGPADSVRARVWEQYGEDTQRVTGNWDWVLPIPMSGGSPRVVPPPQ